MSRDRAAVPELRTEILTSQAFVEFGEVLDCPDKTARFFYNQCLENRRPEAKPDLSIALIPPVQQFPLTLRVMERHPYSSQTFIPMRVQRYLVIVAPDHPGGGPDMTGARAYIAAPDQGITYRPGVWHHGMTVLDGIAQMAVFMWCVGGEGDEEFFELEQPLQLRLSGGAE